MTPITKANLEAYMVRIRDYLTESEAFCEERGIPIDPTFTTPTIAMALKTENYDLARRVGLELLGRGHVTIVEDRRYQWVHDHG